MTRETKVGMLVGLGVILLVGIIVSDHLSVAQNQQPARRLTDMASRSQDGLVAAGDGNQAMNPDARPTAIPLPGEPKQQQQLTPASGGSDVVGPKSKDESTLVMDKPAGSTPRGQIAKPDTTGGVPILQAGNKIAEVDPNVQTHIVKQGDSLYSLAKIYYKTATNSQIALIRDANKTTIGKGDGLKLGAKLVIPALPAKVTPAPVEPTAIAAGAPGTAGTLTPTALAPTQVKPEGIFGKPTETASNTVTVEKGQTLSIIAAKYLGSAQRWSEIKDLNKGIDPNNLKVGTKLTLPTAKADAEARSDAKSKPTASAAPTSPLAPSMPTRTGAGPAVLPAAGASSALPAPATPIASAIKSPNL